MANAIYKKLADGSYINQGYPGGPAVMRISVVAGAPSALSAWDMFWSYNGETFAPFQIGFASSAAAQAGLDNYVTSLINGTAGP